MRIGPFDLTRRKSAPGANFITQWPATSSWSVFPFVREAFAGAWQRSVHTPVQDALTHPTFWSGVTLIAGDIAKMRLKLVAEDADGICTELENPAYSPVIRKPNHYQNRIQFYTYWILSKLTRGNAYALKERDGRGVVTALYLLDPTRVKPLVGPSGEVFYALQQDPLSGITETSVIAPAREIIHDLMFALYHPLAGLSPIMACGHAIIQALRIVDNTTTLFENGAQLAGVLSAPAAINNETAARIEKHWAENYGGQANAGRVAVLGDGLKFERPPVLTAVDAQLIDQLKWGDEKICSVLHIPPYMVGVGPMPSYNNIDALNQQYYSQCLQVLIESLELSLFEGLELKAPLSVEFDLDDLGRMDASTKMKTTTDGIKGGVFTPNDGRQKFNLKPLVGGNTVYLQDQDHSLEWLSRRDAMPILPPAPPPVALPPAPVTDDMPPKDARVRLLKAIEERWSRAA